MRHFILATALVLPLAVDADEGPWVPMTGQEIRTALTDQSLQYESARQTFYASGRTLYDAGGPSWGYWRVDNDQYCSMWPPSDLWACYRMDRRGDMLRFVGQSDDITEAQLSGD